MKSALQPILAILFACALASLVGIAGSQGGLEAFGLPLFAWCGIVAFVLNWIAFVPAMIARTEHYYDLTGSLTYLTLVVLAVAFGEPSDPRTILLAALVGVWALRLGTFLFLRVKKAGKDSRFDTMKQSFPVFLMAWTLQALWVYLTLCAALAAMTAAEPVPLGIVAYVGAAIWIVGFGIEVVADAQKSRFRADPANKGRFIKSGLWSRSRHPNYFGEIVLWVGIAVIAFPVLAGWQLVTLISPVFVTLLLTKVSGIPMLDRSALERWGEDPKYQEYRARTPVLVPRILPAR